MDLNHVPTLRNACNRLLLRVFCVLALLLAPAPATAQFTGYTSPQGVVAGQPPILNAVFAPTIAAVPQNLGQNIHVVTYSISNAATVLAVQIRLEASFNNSTWFPISDDATDRTATGGEVIGIGYFPFLRVNLLLCTGCDASHTLTANYSGTSATGQTPYGFYNPSQQIRKLVFMDLSQGSNQTGTVVAPYGSSAGTIIVFGGNNCAQCSGVNITCVYPETSTLIYAAPLSSTVALQAVNEPSTSCNSVSVTFVSSGASASTVSVYYLFSPPGSLPGSMQPAQAISANQTATNATVTVTLTPPSVQTAYLFTVAARCSAGTAQATVTDTTTGGTIFSSAATEVATTTFKMQWSPGLSIPAGHVMTVTLSTCGAANVGTLHVQGSIF